jgi:hypothetical protein
MDGTFKDIEFTEWDQFCNLNREDENKITNWFAEFDKIKDINQMEQKIIMVMGDAISFKSAFAKFILEKMSYETRLFNAIDMRGAKSIKECIVQIINSKSILNMLFQKPDRIGIVLDDLDIPNNANDKSVITDFISLLSVKKRGKKEQALRITHPIICVCQETNDKKINELKKISLVVKLKKFCENDFRQYLLKISRINGINFNGNQVDMILAKMDNDIRKIYNFVKDLYYFTKDSDNKEINDDNLRDILMSFGKKNTSEKSIDKLNEIFTREELEIDDSINKFYSDKFLYPFMIHENYLYNMPDLIDTKDKLNYCREIANNLSKNDVIQNLIFEKQLWELNNNSAILTLAKTNSLHKKLLENYDGEYTFKKRKYTTLLNKVSLYYTNRKVYNTLLQKYGITYMEIYLLSEVIRILITNKAKKETITELVNIIQHLNLDIDYIDLLVRINKFGSVDIKKFYTCKYKSEIKRQLEELSPKAEN